MTRIVPKTATGKVIYTNSYGTRYTVGSTPQTPFEAAFVPQSKKWTERLVSKIQSQIKEPILLVREGSFSS